MHALVNRFHGEGLRLVEVDKASLATLPDIVVQLREVPYKFVLFCDDLSFEADDASYKALKSALEGSIFRSSANVLIYATSNRRHLLPEYMSDNQQAVMVDGELHQGEAIEEKISLSDRFGLWLSFYPPTQTGFLEIVDSYFPDYSGDRGTLHKAALDFAHTRGSKSGRTAKQFFNSYSVID